MQPQQKPASQLNLPQKWRSVAEKITGSVWVNASRALTLKIKSQVTVYRQSKAGRTGERHKKAACRGEGGTLVRLLF